MSNTEVGLNPGGSDMYEMTVQWSGFLQDIEKFNEMYKLPSGNVPTLASQRMQNFKSILIEEVDEAEPIVQDLNSFAGHTVTKTEEEILTDIADWLGDVVVYCTSEMRRYGLKPAKVLEIIMQSNFSKLGADGQPIYDERGKVQKGPGYWKPEPKLLEYIKEARNG